MLFTVFCASRRRRNRRTLAADISCQNGTKIGRHLEGALLDIDTETGELWPEGRQNSEGCKNCNVFLVHRLTERDEIWHDDGHW